MHQGRRGSILEQLRVLQFVRRVGKLGLGAVSIAIQRASNALSIHILCCSEENSVESIELPPIDADKRRPLSA